MLDRCTALKNIALSIFDCHAALENDGHTIANSLHVCATPDSDAFLAILLCWIFWHLSDALSANCNCLPGIGLIQYFPALFHVLGLFAHSFMK